jgi:hypothetical protein
MGSVRSGRQQWFSFWIATSNSDAAHFFAAVASAPWKVMVKPCWACFCVMAAVELLVGVAVLLPPPLPSFRHILQLFVVVYLLSGMFMRLLDPDLVFFELFQSLLLLTLR